MKRNCWTCKHDDRHEGCDAVKILPSGDRCPVEVWIDDTNGDWINCMPPKDADGCPGYEKRNGKRTPQ
jgi:hypothetical protein